MLQFGASLTDDTRSINYDRNMFIIQATELLVKNPFWITIVEEVALIASLQDFVARMHSNFFQGKMGRDLFYWPNHSGKLGYPNKKRMAI